MRRAVVWTVALLFLLCCTGCEIDLGIPELPAPKEPVKVTGIDLFASAAEIAVGGRYLLSPDPADGNTFWTTSNAEVATVEEGLVTGLSEGETVVTASNGSEMSSCTVVVKPLELGVKVTASDANLVVGNFIAFGTGLPANCRASWSSSDESVASVEGGVVSATGAGVATVTATYGDFSSSYTVTVIDPEARGRQLIWSDEFEGDALDATKWEFQRGVQDVYVNNGKTSYGPKFWGNNELQYYTEDAVSLSDGVLTVTAAREEGLPEGREFTSARIATRDRGFWTYGYFEARMKLPEGVGMWPAFWLLPQPEAGMGTNNRYGGWAANGEVDIMEAKGRLPYEVGNTLHFGGNPSTYSFRTVHTSSSISEWHTYGLEWRSGYMAWFVDGTETFRLSNTSWYTNSPLGANDPSAPFNVPFYIIFNFAVGGNYDQGRRPDASFESAAMQIDYVRVYA